MRREGRIPHARYGLETHKIPDAVTGEMVEANFCTYRIETKGSNHSKCSQPHFLFCSGKVDQPWNKAQCKIKGQKKWNAKHIGQACNDQGLTGPCDSKTQKALMIAEDLDAEDCESDSWAPSGSSFGDPQSIPFTISDGRKLGGFRRGHRRGHTEESEELVWLDHLHGLRGRRGPRRRRHHHHHLAEHQQHGPPHHRHHPRGVFGLAILHQQPQARAMGPPPGLDSVPASFWETVRPEEPEADDDEGERDTLTENWNVPMEGWGRTDEPWDVLTTSTQLPTLACSSGGSGLCCPADFPTDLKQGPALEETGSIASKTESSDESAMTEGFSEAPGLEATAALELDWQSVSGMSGDDWESISDGVFLEADSIDEL